MSAGGDAKRPDAGASNPEGARYVVVARRYRPQTFEELVGQEHVSRALRNAITTQRVGHAYLFTGVRGVGKTSTARILAKALNCVRGPTPRPCNECDICQSISAGEDVDVLEIDGASNRGIDEVRQLRSNAGVRPSRARSKIYIIDEVHMLTPPAFNALLKTLEEPPGHVKFIFCTTDPEKIPVTVLSRCQRFDFAPLEAGAIAERLKRIVDSEAAEAEPEALQLIARRASGSMRDSQSLLEQLLAFHGDRITVADVHAMLGTAPSGQLAAMAGHIASRDAAAALRELDRAVAEGVDVGQLAEQLVGRFRDMMAAAVGCPADLMLTAVGDDRQSVAESARQLGLQAILAALQILDEALVRMRQSLHARTLLEAALVRCCKLDELDELAEAIARLDGAAPAPDASSASSPAPPQKKKDAATQAAPAAPDQRTASALSDQNADALWREALAAIEDMTADFAAYYDHVATPAPNRLVVRFPAGYTHQKESCERPDRKSRIESALRQVTGQPVRVDFEVQPGPGPTTVARPRTLSRRERIRQKEKHPLVKRAMELFEAELISLEEARVREQPSDMESEAEEPP